MECHELIIDEDNKICYINNEEINLTKKEYELFNYFVSNPNKLITRENLKEIFWNKDIVLRTIDVTISRLKKKLGLYGGRIKCRQGFGYVFDDK